MSRLHLSEQKFSEVLSTIEKSSQPLGLLLGIKIELNNNNRTRYLFPSNVHEGYPNVGCTIIWSTPHPSKLRWLDTSHKLLSLQQQQRETQIIKYWAFLVETQIIQCWSCFCSLSHTHTHPLGVGGGHAGHKGEWKVKRESFMLNEYNP